MGISTFPLRQFQAVALALGLLASSLAAQAQPATPRPWSWGTALQHPTLNGAVQSISTTVDAAGNQYVVGKFQGTVAFGATMLTSHSIGYLETDLYVAKRSPTGQWLWAVGAGNAGTQARASDIALDPQGNLVVLGSFTGRVRLGSRMLISPNNTLLVARLSPQGQWLNATSSISVNSVGLLTYATEKAGKLAVDGQGNAFVTGRFRGEMVFGSQTLGQGQIPQFSTSFVACVSAAGIWQWANAIGNVGQVVNTSSVAVGPQGDVWVGGDYSTPIVTIGSTPLILSTGIYNEGDLFLAHLSGTGQWISAIRAGGPESDLVERVVVDAQNNVYLTGSFIQQTIFGGQLLTTAHSPNSSYPEAYVAKLGANGQWQWVRGGGGDGGDTGQEIVIDPQGEVYWSGLFNAGYSSISALEFGPTTIPPSTEPLQGGSFISKIGPAGQWRWTKSSGSLFSCYQLTGTPQGQVYVASNTFMEYPLNMPGIRETAFQDIIVGQLSAQGQLSMMGQSESGGSASVSHLIHDGQGNTYVTGSFQGSLVLGTTPLYSKGWADIFVAKLNRQGQVQWALQAGSKGNEVSHRLVLDAQGGLILTGASTDTLTLGTTTVPGSHQSASYYLPQNGFLSRISPQGQWVSAIKAPVDITALRTNASGSLWLSGSFSDSLNLGAIHLQTRGGTDGYIARLSPTNQWQWAQQIGTASTESIGNIVLDSANNVYVLGDYGDTLTLGAIILPNPNWNSQATYLARLNAAGQWDWAQMIVSPFNFFNGGGLGMAPNGRQLLVSGVFADTLQLGISTLTTDLFQQSTFVGAMDLSGQWQWGISPRGSGMTLGGPVEADRYGMTYLLGSLTGDAHFGTDSIFGRPGRRLLPSGPLVADTHGRGGPPLPPIPTPFIASFNAPPGQWQSAELMVGATTMTVSTEGDLFVAGTQISDVTTGGFTHTASLLPIGFVTAKLNGPTGLTPATATRARLGLWPNPAHHAVQLMGLPKGATSVRVLDGVGRIVLQQPVTGNPEAISLALPSSLVPGLYTVQCGGASQRLVVE
jgi:hypothetical protein